MKPQILCAAAMAVTLSGAPVAVAQEPVSAPLAAEADAGSNTAPAPVEGDSGEATARDAAIAEVGGEADPADNWQGNAGELYAAIRSGRWLAAIAAGLLLAVFVVRRFLLRRVAWFQTRAGGWAINATLATAATMAVEMRAGVFGLASILDAILIGLSAAGTYQAVRDVKRRAVANDNASA